MYDELHYLLDFTAGRQLGIQMGLWDFNLMHSRNYSSVRQIYVYLCVINCNRALCCSLLVYKSLWVWLVIFPSYAGIYLPQGTYTDHTVRVGSLASVGRWVVCCLSLIIHVDRMTAPDSNFMYQFKDTILKIHKISFCYKEMLSMGQYVRWIFLRGKIAWAEIVTLTLWVYVNNNH